MKSTSLGLDTSPSSNGSANARMISDILGSPPNTTTRPRPAGTVRFLLLFLFFDMPFIPCPAGQSLRLPSYWCHPSSFSVNSARRRSMAFKRVLIFLASLSISANSFWSFFFCSPSLPLFSLTRASTRAAEAETKGYRALKGEKEFTTYQGCGDYVPDQRLHGKWRIVKADTLVLGIDRFENKIPELNIDAYEGQVSGNDGCNSFRGQIKFRDNELIFGMLAETMMACPNMDISSVITRTFTEKKLRYLIQKDLFFYEGEKEVMMLQRMD